MTDANERRRSSRFAVEVPCRVTVSSPAWYAELSKKQLGVERVSLSDEMAGESFEGTLLDFSESGARITAGRIPALLTRLQVSFDLADHGPAEVTGLVMWRTKVTVPVKRADGTIATPSFGILFEVAPIELRRALHERGAEHEAVSPKARRELVPW